MIIMAANVMYNKNSVRNVLVAMSGGVDSSVAALILRKKDLNAWEQR